MNRKMVSLSSILEHNQQFVQERKYEPYQTTKFPKKKLVIVSCMDTRLTELLPQAMGLRNGDAKIIKNAGAIVSHPFGSVMRSILVAVYELQAEEVCIIGHRECGMSGLNAASILNKAKERGVEDKCLSLLQHAGVDLETWLTGFHSVEESVAHSVNMVRHHPLLPEEVPVHGLVIDPGTGMLDVVVDGYETVKGGCS
ncbi:carbonic anhydrase [Bacillus velezensis]|nr:MULTISPECIES: carbonic anhydrase [Bacillus]ASP24158.1 carbonic anhydrase [Bacillus velezensis]ATO08863.1 carbonic anhydrase [Bacillus velezensis]AZI48610.1 carbonic anhydrase [Bacillus velezensis]MBE7959279.1 carbonic anhydrase [Bacillus amyloliquefaciens]QRO09789.1 carbonic anhydrase [Bacillus velezensis]